MSVVEGMLNLFYVQAKGVGKLTEGVTPRQKVKAVSKPQVQMGGNSAPMGMKSQTKKALPAPRANATPEQ